MIVSAAAVDPAREESCLRERSRIWCKKWNDSEKNLLELTRDSPKWWGVQFLNHWLVWFWGESSGVTLKRRHLCSPQRMIVGPRDSCRTSKRGESFVRRVSESDSSGGVILKWIFPGWRSTESGKAIRWTLTVLCVLLEDNQLPSQLLDVEMIYWEFTLDSDSEENLLKIVQRFNKTGEGMRKFELVVICAVFEEWLIALAAIGGSALIENHENNRSWKIRIFESKIMEDCGF